MYLTTWVRKDFILHPQYLSNPRDNLRLQINDLITSCSKDYGCIVDVLDINWSSMKNIVSRVSGSCIFSVDIQVRCFQPDKGIVIQSQVTKIFPEGIFTVFKGIPIFVPITELTNWEFRMGSFYEKDTNRVIGINDEIEMEVTLVRFNSKTYECIAKLHKKVDIIN